LTLVGDSIDGPGCGSDRLWIAQFLGGFAMASNPVRSSFLILAAVAMCAAPLTQADKLSDFTKTMSQQMSGPSGAGLSDADIGAGLKEALAKGTREAVNQLGHTDGFWSNERFRIPLPGIVLKAQSLLQTAGYGPQVDALHLQMNRAAEQAVPVAADVFSEAVQKLTLDDVRGILSGGDDAATQYFKRTTSDTLTTRFKPIVAKITAQSGLVQQYNSVLAGAGPMASMLGEKGDINSFVTQKALDGLFLRVGDEEKNIRQNPAARSSELLKKVFGS
jgi:hypothetical protein